MKAVSSTHWDPYIEQAYRISARAKKLGLTAWESVKEDIRQGGTAHMGNVATIEYLSAASIAEVMEIFQGAEERSFSTCFYSERASSYMNSVAPSIGSEAAASQFTFSFHLASHALCGRHRFVTSEGLATLLALTELRGLKAEDLRLPQQSMYIEVPSFLGLKVFSQDSGLHPLSGVFIHEDKQDDATVPRAVNPGRSWRVLMVSEAHDQTGFDFKFKDYAQSFFSLPLIPGDTVEEAFERLRVRASANNSFMVEENMETWLAAWRWVMNVVVYATTPDADADHIRGNKDAEDIWRRVQKMPKSEKRDRLREKLKSMPQDWYTLLGRKTVLTPSLREMYEHNRAKGNGSPLRVRTLVSGHWQRYAVGEGRKEREWKFRAPFWRGPDDGSSAKVTEHVLG